MDNVPSSNGYKGGFGTALMTKDLGLAQDAATRAQAATPLGSLAHQVNWRGLFFFFFFLLSWEGQGKGLESRVPTGTIVMCINICYLSFKKALGAVDLDNYVETISRLSRKQLSALAVLGRFLSTGLVTNTIFRYDFLKNMKNCPSTRITRFLDLLKT